MERNKIAAKLIKGILKDSPDTHNIYTPLELCDEMITKLPVLNTDMIILVMFNLEFIWIIKEKIKDLKNVWFLTPDQLKKKAAIGMGINENNVVIYEYNNKRIIGEEKMPKFDVVVGNPPYKRSMHLQFLELAYNSLKENGQIIWLHPARWLQDPTAVFKKNSDYTKYKDLPFNSFYFIPVNEAQRLFNVSLTSDLSISVLKNNEKSIINENKIYELRNIPISLKKLLHTKYTSFQDVVETNKNDGIRVKIISIQIFATKDGRNYIKNRYSVFHHKHAIPFINGQYNGKHWTNLIAKNQFSKSEKTPLPLSIKFNTIEEAQNFIDSTNTEVFQFFNYLTKLDVHIQLKYLPFMEDYTKSWTNERFQEYFKISNDEMIYIKNIMNKYK